MSESFDFFQVLKDNSSKDSYDNVDECISEWKIILENYSCCGCRHGNNDSNVSCVDCICGEKCIYRQFKVKNKINGNILVIGSSCVKKFFKNTLYEEYKEEKKEIESEKRRAKKNAEYYYNLKKCTDCFSNILYYPDGAERKCYICKFITEETKVKLQKESYCNWIVSKSKEVELKGQGKLSIEFINKKKENLELIEAYKKILGIE
jgi:hypothetical protein